MQVQGPVAQSVTKKQKIVQVKTSEPLLTSLMPWRNSMNKDEHRATHVYAAYLKVKPEKTEVIQDWASGFFV